ncbi:Nitrogenase molybdenum-iron protein [Pseudomonas syringae pv. actinidiae]|uniref:Nitrogenase molybdenum-iron protein n=1 Tax=Pseudomonas syringae pv. actinidiae TaxID=103796 RepID=A0AAN4Q3T8_PSESF|nr:Nitrogenase molybdenum-iron protein [Pseudomonas syringae pv. actinidiae]
MKHPVADAVPVHGSPSCCLKTGRLQNAAVNQVMVLCRFGAGWLGGVLRGCSGS